MSTSLTSTVGRLEDEGEARFVLPVQTSPGVQGPIAVDTKVLLSLADDGVLDVSVVLRVQVRGLHLEDAGPGLGVLRHLRPLDGLAEGVVVVNDESHHGAQPHLPLVRPSHYEPVVLLRLEVREKMRL